MAHDIVIRGGELVDGTGADPVAGDLAVDDGLITAVGKVDGKGKQEIDAKGLAVTPGFVDLHTHLDAQIGWDPSLTPVSWHGVTTALLGNCGVTFAPCKPDDVELLAGMMETVEDIPKNAILTGLPWDWEDYGGYLDAIERLEPAINVAGMVGHCAVRFYVMGERAVEEQASDDERKQMADVVAHSIDRGAVGFSTNRYPPHKLPDGRSIPGTFAEVGELVEIAKAVGPRNALMQAVGANFEVLRAMAETTKGRILFSYGTGPQEGMGAKSAEGLEQLSKYGDLTAITQVRGSGFMFGLQSNLPVQGETWDKLRKQNLEERLAAIRDPETREKLVDEGLAMKRRFPMTNVFYLGDGESPDYTTPPDQNLEAVAKANNEHWVETFLRLSDETDGRALFNLRMFNQSLKELGDLFKSEHIFPSLGDAGAHVSQIMDAGWSSFILSYWIREAGVYSLSEGIRRMTSGPARVLGLKDRGALKPGLRADINVLDPGKVAERQPVLVHDFPGGAPRYIQKSLGYKTTIVNGEVTLVDGEHTGARAGRVLRHAG
ncbi:MAG: amidohydrolase family protein [Gammaproteobacteria bacterium]|nr:amidohydrolase family protein [Gammaproteobacteria bacterium]MYF27885.1 amidohydrolase family protein [Gammaproteobacteria bacterium]MYK47007.1 amidohydrolase family protein [Gammaproteobacteria bacterium]